MALRKLVAAPLRVLPSGTEYYPPINSLVNKLNKCHEDHLAITKTMMKLDSIATPRVDIQLMSGDPRRMVLADGPNSKIVKIEWQPGQIITRHRHPDLYCWMKILTGTLCESIWHGGASNFYTRNHFSTSGVREIVNEQEEHSLVNNRLTPAVSLHFYMHKDLQMV